MLDLADGKVSAYSRGGMTLRRLFDRYNEDGGHLNARGSERVATAPYSLLGTLSIKPHVP